MLSPLCNRQSWPQSARDPVSRDWEIFHWDGASTTQRTSKSYDDTFPQIQNGQIVWYGSDGNGYETFYWDGSTIYQIWK